MPRKAVNPPISETTEHLRIARHLRRHGLADDAVIFHLRGERAGFAQRINATRMGVVSGLPDWQVLHAGRVGFIELKPRGWLRRRARYGSYTTHEHQQHAMHDRLRNAGAWVEVCETLEEMIETLAAHGVKVNTVTLADVLIAAGAERANAATA